MFLNHDFELTNCTLRSDTETYRAADESLDDYLHAFQSRSCVPCMCSESIKANERLFCSHCFRASGCIPESQATEWPGRIECDF